MTGYDSRPDTLAHSQRVGELMVQVVHEVLDRSTCHDRSKTLPPEVEVFDRTSPRLKSCTYGSAAYKGFLADMGEGLAHHYAHNRHHPEFHQNGVSDMTLADLIEMLADWKAATERHDDGDLTKSLAIQRERFGLSDQLVSILQNTAVRYGWMMLKPAGMPEAWCCGLDDAGRTAPSRQGRHEPHEWFDISSVSDLWCHGSQEEHEHRRKEHRAGRSMLAPPSDNAWLRTEPTSRPSMIRRALKRLLCRPGTRELLTRLAGQLNRMESTMATQDDVNDLSARVGAVKTAVDTGVTGIRSDLEAIKAAHPDLDLSALDASVAALETSVQSVTDLDAENPAPAEPEVVAEPETPQG